MATHWKKQLADAHQHARKLDNRIHELEQERANLLANLDMEVRRREMAEAKAMDVAYELAESRSATKADATRPLADVELFALASMMAMESLAPTPARRAMMSAAMREMVGRGILLIPAATDVVREPMKEAA